MYKKTDILGYLPREIAYQVAGQFSPKEYITFCRVSKKWTALLHSDSLVNDIIRQHFNRHSDLAYYKNMEDRFSVLRNLVFREHAHRAGLVMKTKWFSYPGGYVSPKYCYSGILVIEARRASEGSTSGIYLLDLDRKAESPLKRVVATDPHGHDIHTSRYLRAGPGFIVDVDRGSECEAVIFDYSGNLVYKWCMNVPRALKMRYLAGCTDRYVVIRAQDDTGQLVHYEVWDARTNGVAAYDIEEDILSRQTVLSREELDEDDPFSLQGFDWAVRECDILIHNDTKTISLSSRFDPVGFYIQRLSFASQDDLALVSETQASFTLPQSPSDPFGDPPKRAFINRGHGVMAVAADPNTPKDLNVDYFQYDYNSPQDGSENIRQESWTVSDTRNPYTTHSRQAFFPMGKTLYGIMAPSLHMAFMRLRRLGQTGKYWDGDDINLEIPRRAFVETFSDDKYAVVAWMGGMLVLEWHDFDSWWEWQAEKTMYEEGVEIRHEFWKDDSDSLANFRYKYLN
ncbi:hypothetical protein TWF281_006438 [Arthrobotrys megalospora]